MIEVFVQRDARSVSVALVVARAGVSRRTFYELFEDREDCLLAALEESFARIARRVVAAYEQREGWRDRVRAGLAALLVFLEEEPAVGRFVLVESLGAGSVALERRRRVVSVLVGVVEDSRGEVRSARGLPALTGECVVGAVLAVLHERLVRDSQDGFVGLLNPLMATIVLPYLGRAAADRELSRPLPARSANSEKETTDPLRDVHMRLTYRTIRVLSTVAANPGSSNRKVADGSGTTDQGQISKLLTRLERLGLVQNVSGSGQGEPNAWTLTTKGTEVHNALTRHTHTD
jgi:AcrR family transcriptional regulator/DNA-binding MarR family transcriptional regulator